MCICVYLYVYLYVYVYLNYVFMYLCMYVHFLMHSRNPNKNTYIGPRTRTQAKEFLVLLEQGKLEKRVVDFTPPRSRAKDPGSSLFDRSMMGDRGGFGGQGGMGGQSGGGIIITSGIINSLLGGGGSGAAGEPPRKTKMTIEQVRPLIEQQEIEKVLVPVCTYVTSVDTFISSTTFPSYMSVTCPSSHLSTS